MVPHPNQIVDLSDIKRTMSNHVLVRRDEPEKVSKAGIVHIGKGKTIHRGTVLCVGPGRVDEKTGERIPSELKEGDRVLLGTGSGATIADQGGYSCFVRNDDGEVEELFLLREHPELNEIMAVIEEE